MQRTWIRLSSASLPTEKRISVASPSGCGPGGSSRAETPLRLLNVIVPLDGSKPAERALDHAREVALGLGLNIHLIRVVSPRTETAEFYYDIEADLLQAATQYLQVVGAKLETGAFNVTTRVFRGFPAAAIVDYATTIDGSVICITTHGRSGLGRLLLGSVADKVLQESHSPVLMVRAQAE